MLQVWLLKKRPNLDPYFHRKKNHVLKILKTILLPYPETLLKETTSILLPESPCVTTIAVVVQ